ncbi:unnamed protein product [Ectocarpus sp. CCAP 1310/34]|nr:unnamed protein product [Ectocarpus sp. CCAP 1310/34]
MQEMIGTLPLLLRAKSDGRGQEESGCAERGTAGAAGLGCLSRREATESCILRSRLQGALVGGGGRRESSGGESAAAGGTKSGASGVPGCRAFGPEHLLKAKRVIGGSQ